jgi:hypothetical protein
MGDHTISVAVGTSSSQKAILKVLKALGVGQYILSRMLSRTIIPYHKSFPNENKQKTKFISLISKYSRTHTITTSVFERDIPLDL